MKKFLLFLLLSVFLFGCHIKSTTSAVKAVTEIDVQYRSDSTAFSRKYSTEVKMRPILNYLRWISPYGVPQENPDALAGDTYTITIHFSDNSEKVYLQKANRYLQVDGQAWKLIDAENARTLSRIINEMESDI